ncbi:carboxylating nicotinate-nucleotide diphosphorylase [Lacticaseibacillus porcinae]|uniref:carboxylating nicotinate-nucleotide diphosphorylase n=1 Tax=Lacticaseibacillus porcinae TaxID=1123687 RepID=UPI000F78E5B3|nr:carboxylating nicotinate-nucleotide diphosphorylase [Lacticaseibacillus porcinae]
MPLSFKQVAPALQQFLNEDLGRGDLTAPLLTGRHGAGVYLAKTGGVIAGLQIPAFLYRILDADVDYRALVQEGEVVAAGTPIAEVHGDLAVLLAAERLSLNLMQRLSGIATATKLAVDTLADPRIQILDTRKTAPGLRVFDKYAVRVGGGVNHRLGLDDMAMLKDNHWAAIGDLDAAIQLLRRVNGPTKMIEVECESRSQVEQAIMAQADIIMFDNQTPQTVKAWQQLIPAGVKTEVSGGIELNNIHDYAGCGADFLSLGYLTNRVVNLDISFNQK